MHIRPLNLADPAELLAAHALQRDAYEIEAALIGTREIPGLTETPAQLASSRETFWGAFLAAPIAGAPLLAGLTATEEEGGLERGSAGGHIRISRLAVGPLFFRRGVGRALVRAVVDDAGRARGRIIWVSTGAANTPGRALYESEGFRLMAERTVGRNPPVRIVEYRWG